MAHGRGGSGSAFVAAEAAMGEAFGGGRPARKPAATDWLEKITIPLRAGAIWLISMSKPKTSGLP